MTSESRSVNGPESPVYDKWVQCCQWAGVSCLLQVSPMLSVGRRLLSKTSKSRAVSGPGSPMTSESRAVSEPESPVYYKWVQGCRWAGTPVNDKWVQGCQWTGASCLWQKKKEACAPYRKPYEASNLLWSFSINHRTINLSSDRDSCYTSVTCITALGKNGPPNYVHWVVSH